MSRVVIVGSGASAVHCALSLLEKGRDVLMLDVGRRGPERVMPEAGFSALKKGLDDPVGYFLGERFEAVLYPGSTEEYYGIPPSKHHVLAGTRQFRWRADGFDPHASFAQGGLAEAWTGGVYPFNDAELDRYPIAYRDLAPYYDLIAKRIGISGAVDDLARFMPVHEHLMPALELDEHSRRLMGAYERRRSQLNERLGCYLGRSRLATISQDKDGRDACAYLGRCLWGCPRRSLYTPSLTLEVCRRFPGFRYESGLYVRQFVVDRAHRVAAVVVENVSSGAIEEIPVETLVLGAGTLSSARIFLDSVYRATGEIVTLEGLMDNRQVLVPFINLSMLGRRANTETYQYHQIGLGLESSAPREYVHGQITTLKSALIHPVVQPLPLGLQTSLAVFRVAHAALGLVNLNFHDTRRSACRVTLEPESGASGALIVHYEPAADEPDRMRSATRRLRTALWSLNCVVPPGMSRIRPMGASVHYAGLLPMSDSRDAWTTSPHGQSREFENLFFVDGTILPALPAKNLTFTLMANAARIADQAL